MTRRNILKSATGVISMTAFGNIVFKQQIANASTGSPYQTLSYSQMVSQIRNLVDHYRKDPEASEIPYSLHMASLMKRVPLDKVKIPAPVAVKDLGGGAEFSIGKKVNFVSENKLTLKAQAHLRAHNHLDFVGVLLCLTGSCRIRNYNIVHESGRDVVLEKTSELYVSKGDIAFILQSKENVHDFQAFDEKMEALEIYSFLKLPTGPPSKFMTLDEQSWNGEMVQAKWDK